MADFSEAQDLGKGVLRFLYDLGFDGVTELTLPNDRRADVVAVDKGGAVIAVEIKMSLADFRADQKWPEYLDYCDRFYFAVPEGFPVDVLPEDHGLLIVDRFGADEARPAPEGKMNASRRRAVTLRLARAASQRLGMLNDPREG